MSGALGFRHQQHAAEFLRLTKDRTPTEVLRPRSHLSTSERDNCRNSSLLPITFDLTRSRSRLRIMATYEPAGLAREFDYTNEYRPGKAARD